MVWLHKITGCDAPTFLYIVNSFFGLSGCILYGLKWTNPQWLTSIIFIGWGQDLLIHKTVLSQINFLL